MTGAAPRPAGIPPVGNAAAASPAAARRMRRADLVSIARRIAARSAWLLTLAYAALIALARPLGPARLGSAAAAASLLLVLATLPVDRRDRARSMPEPPGSAIPSVMLFLHADLLIAWLVLPASGAGRYAGAALLTRWIVLLAVAWSWTVRRSRRRDDDPDPYRWLHRSIGGLGVVVVVAVVFIVLWRSAAATLVLGPAYAGASTSVPILAVAGAFLAVAWQLSFLHVAVASRAHVLLLATVIAEAAAVALAGPSVDRVAGVALVGAATGATFQYVGARAITRWSPPLATLRPHREFASAAPQQDVELSLILPCYNLGQALGSFLHRLIGELRGQGRYELIVVSDGSTDDSVAMVRELDSPAIRVLHYTERAGKGHALRVGLREARGAFIGFIDADGEIDPQAVGPFLTLMRLYSPDIVLGSKRHPMSNVRYPPLRRVMSWVYHKLTRVLFRINVRDTQTGLKLIRRDVLADVLPRMFEKRYAFDLEMLVVARFLGFTNVFEAPVKIDYGFSSTVNPDAVFRILLDTAAIFYRRYILDTYRYAGDRLLIVRDDASGPTYQRTV